MAIFKKKDGTVIERDDKTNKQKVVNNVAITQPTASEASGDDMLKPVPVKTTSLNKLGVMKEQQDIKSIIRGNTNTPTPAPDWLGVPGMRSNPIAGSQAAGTLKGETSNTAFGEGLTGTADAGIDSKGIDNQAGFDQTDTSPTQNILEGIGADGYGAFFTDVINKLGRADKNIDPLHAGEMKREYEKLFNEAQGDPNKLNQLQTSLEVALAKTVESQNIMNKLDYDKNSILAQFDNGQEVVGKIEQLKDFIEAGETDPNVLATKMNMSVDDILKAQRGDYTGFGGELTGEYKDEISEDIELAMTRAEEDEKRNTEIGERTLANQMADELEAKKRAERIVEINEINGSKLSGLTGVGYSSLGAKGIAEAHQQGKDMMDDIRKNYGRAQQQTKDALSKLATDYARQNEDYRNTLEDRIQNVSNSFFTSIQAIKDRYGSVSTEAVKALAEEANKYQSQIHQQEMNYAENNRQNHATYNAMKDQIMQEDLFFREQQQYEIQDAVNNSLNTTYGEVLNQVKNGTYSAEMGRKVMTGMQQSVTNYLEGIAPGASGVFSQKVDELLKAGNTPAQVLEEIMTGEEFKKYAPAESLGGDKYKLFGDLPTSPSSSPAPTQQTVLSEEVTDTGIPNVYGGTVQLVPTVGAMVKEAQDTLAEQGIDLKIADSAMSYETKLAAYNKRVEGGKVGPTQAHPDDSFHVKGQAFDLSQKGEDNMNNETVFQALRDAGLQQLPGEWRHWSFGEMGASMDLDSMADEDFTFDFLVDSFEDAQLLDFEDVREMKGTERQKRLKDNPDQKDAFVKYDKISDKVDANSNVPLRYRMAVWQQIPNRQKDNVAERKDIYEQIEKMHEMGISQEDAPLLYMAFEIDNPEDKPFAMELVNIHKINSGQEGLVTHKVKELSNFVNNGDYESAVGIIENDPKIYNRVDENASRMNMPNEIKARFTIDRIQLTLDALEDAGWTQAGFLGGTAQRMLGKLKGTDAAYLEALMTQQNFEVMASYIGADMTANEVKAIMPILPQLNDKPSIVIKKLQQMQDNAIMGYNAARSQMHLPELTAQQLADGPSGKVEAYMQHLSKPRKIMSSDIIRITDSLNNDVEEGEEPWGEGTVWMSNPDG